MKRSFTLLALIFLLLAQLPLASGQDSDSIIEPADADMVNPEAHISFPPPVYVVRDSLEIRGTVTIEGMRNFFVEFRPLALGAMADDEGAEANEWVPATLPRIAPVDDDVLGIWNTAIVRDGLYELRLTINTGAAEPGYYRVSPIRVENTRPDFLVDDAAGQQAVVVEEPAAPAEPTAMPEPTAIPEPTATPDPTPRVVALRGSNVRAGDSTSYSVVGGLREGQSARLRGISSFGTGWYYIELDSGRRGFIHPNLVRTEGDVGSLARINPPPLPPTPIPPPTAVPAPTTGPNLRILNVQMSPHPAKCNEAYEIQATIRNDGNAASGPFALKVQDSRHDGAGLIEHIIGGAPLAVGEQRTFGGYLTQSQYFDELHHVNVYVDAYSEVSELNEGDNHYAVAAYMLAKHNC